MSKIMLNNKKYESRTIFNFYELIWLISWGLYYRSLSPIGLFSFPSRWKLFKNLPGTCGFAYGQFFFKMPSWEVISSLKKTIVLYLVKKFETILVILTSGQKRVFLKGKNVLYHLSGQSILYWIFLIILKI